MHQLLPLAKAFSLPDFHYEVSTYQVLIRTSVRGFVKPWAHALSQDFREQIVDSRASMSDFRHSRDGLSVAKTSSSEDGFLSVYLAGPLSENV